jgi:hypothetical protein
MKRYEEGLSGYTYLTSEQEDGVELTPMPPLENSAAQQVSQQASQQASQQQATGAHSTAVKSPR